MYFTVVLFDKLPDPDVAGLDKSDTLRRDVLRLDPVAIIKQYLAPRAAKSKSVFTSHFAQKPGQAGLTGEELLHGCLFEITLLGDQPIQPVQQRIHIAQAWRWRCSGQVDV